MKKRYILSAVFCLSLLCSPPIKASESSVYIDFSKPINHISNSIKPTSINPIRYRKVNVNKYEEWSDWETVSGIVHADKVAGGSITATSSHEFDVEFSGIIQGLGISTSISYSSSIGHTINLQPGKSGYMQVRMKYKVEKGEREAYDVITGQTYGRNKYIVKTPIKHTDSYRVRYI